MTCHPLTRWCAAGLLVLAGCLTPQPLPDPERFQPPTDRMAVGDWDDLDSAVRVGASQSEMAILSVLRPDELTVHFELLTITDEPASLEVHRERYPDDGGSYGMHLRARVGLFGDAAWEARFLDRVVRRLRDLAGVDVAPLSEP